MNRTQLTLAVALPLVVVAGAATLHRYNRNQELARQEAVKTEGLVPVTLATVEKRPFRSVVPFTGTLLAVNRAELKAEVGGRVTRVSVREGDLVAPGTVLSVQDEEDLLLSVQAAEAQVAQAQAQLAQARRDHERMQSLLEKRSVTKQAAQQAETYFNATQAATRAAESNLGLAKSRLHKAQIRSPFAGHVAQAIAQVGEILNPGQPAFTVVDNRKMEILADLPTEAVSQVQVGMKARIKVAGFDAPVEGKVTQVAAAVLQDGRTLRVRMEVPNLDGRLKSGLFVDGEILGEGATERLALPASSLTAMGREAEVFVAENGIARRRKVVLAGEQDGWRPVQGLEAGMKIVAMGRDVVADGSRLKVVDAPEGQVK